MNSILYIKSTFRSYNMCLSKNEEIIFFKHYTFMTHSEKSKMEELQNSSLTNTMALIECAKNNDIDSFVLKFNGPLAIKPFNIELLNEHGINIRFIVDKTPIPHNICRPQKKKKK